MTSAAGSIARVLLGCALYDRAPYRGLLTHGFATDGQGRKMSKSLGNTRSSRKPSPSEMGAGNCAPAGGQHRLLR